MVLELKYGARPEVAEDLGRELAEAIAREAMPDPASTVVTAVPGASWRVWHRGVDHAWELARVVGYSLHLPAVKLLAHSGAPPRSGREASERPGRTLRHRRDWPAGSMDGLHLLLLDDVLTTGTTVREAVRCLRRLRPLDIVVGVIAVAPDPRRGSKAADSPYGIASSPRSGGGGVKNISTNP